MVRGKIVMKRIENGTNRQVTFSKRRKGLMKKAYELSVLCDSQVSVIIFSQNGNLYEFSSSDMQRSIERYRKYGKEWQTDSYSSQAYMQKLKHEVEESAKKVELLEISKRKLLGRGIDSCSLDELKEIEKQLELSLLRIRERKSQLFMEQREQLIAKEKLLLEENARLSSKSCGKPWQPEGADAEGAIVRCCSKSSKSHEIETELFIGLPCHSHSHRKELC